MKLNDSHYYVPLKGCWCVLDLETGLFPVKTFPAVVPLVLLTPHSEKSLS